MTALPTARFAALALLVLCLGPTLARAADEPTGVLAGWDRFDGRVLLGELNCTACHAAGSAAERITSKQPPILAEVGSRVTPQYLRKFLADPLGVKPGTTMPDMLHGLPAADKAKAVEALTHYLAGLGEPLDQRSSGASVMQIAKGEELYHTVGCVACHAPSAAPPKHKADPSAVPLDEDETVAKPKSVSVPHGPLAMKTTVAALAKFLADPVHVRPSGRMPNLNLRPGEPATIAAYLLRDQLDPSQKAIGAGIDWAFYKKNFNKTADFDKETPTAEGDVDRIDLAAIKLPGGKAIAGEFGIKFTGVIEIETPGKYRFSLFSDDGSTLKIGEKLVVNHDGAHSPAEKLGEVELTKGRHPFELRMFNSGGGFELAVKWQPPGRDRMEPLATGVLLRGAAAMVPQGIVDFKVDPVQAAEGKKLFTSLGCASCHVVDRNQPAAAPAANLPALARADAKKAGGCLSEQVAAGRPKYDLVPKQRAALTTAIAAANRPELPSAAEKLDHTLTTMNCYACHNRGGKGGPDAERFRYFTYEVPVDLGDEGRTPPPLSETGAKLTAAGWEDMLVNGYRYRSYMATRMPQFGKANVATIPEQFAKVDAGKLPAHAPQSTAKLIDDGRTLAGKKGVTCINCHAWGPLRLPGAEGLDLLYAPKRLQPEWFYAWLADPQKLKPRTRMPTVWFDGKSAFPKIQEGDMSRQIDAIWAYLAAGEKGGIPAGLTPSDGNLLVPTDEPIVFRTFLDPVGAHAILVGFRQRTHMAFDANRVRTVAAWNGDFVSTQAAWEGRAGMYAKIPSPQPVLLPNGPAFAVLASEGAPWPADLPKGKPGTSRTPEGWRFKGYRYEADRTPTFLYSIGIAEVEETPSTDFRADASLLVRKLRLTAAEAPANLYFRIAEGAKIEEADGGYVVDGNVRFRVTAGGKPSIRQREKTQELLLPVKFQPTPAGQEAVIQLEMLWK